MPAPRCRPFTVLDGMILVAATAVSIVLLKIAVGYFGAFYGPFSEPHDLTDGSDIPYLGSITGLIRCGSVPVLLPASLALLVIRLRKPRPALRRLARQPGFAACSVVALIVTIDLMCRLVTWFSWSLYSDWGSVPFARWLWHMEHRVMTFAEWYRTQPLMYIHPLLAAAVTAVWAAMAIGHNWRRERGWIDWIATTVGGLWVLDLFAYCLNYDWR